VFTSTSRELVMSAVGLIAATLVASTAAAGVRPDDRGGLLGVGATSAAATVPVRPDDRSGRIGIGAVTDPVDDVTPIAVASVNTPVRPDDRTEPRGPGAFFAASVEFAALDSFQWDDAALGALAALGTVLLAGAAAVTKRLMRPATP
jgi:hypothetical protein